jgi:hypothetical protein
LPSPRAGAFADRLLVDRRQILRNETHRSLRPGCCSSGTSDETPLTLAVLAVVVPTGLRWHRTRAEFFGCA